MRIPVVLIAFALGAFAPSALLAHVELAVSTPAEGSAVKAPKAITLTFSQPVDPANTATGIVMTAMPGMPDHGEMEIRNFTANWSADRRTVTLAVKKPLPAGTYQVRWQAVAADGQPMSGTVGFTAR